MPILIQPVRTFRQMSRCSLLVPRRDPVPALHLTTGVTPQGRRSLGQVELVVARGC